MNLQDIINAMREVTLKTPPVIFTSPYWNGICLRVEETGDLAVGDDAIQMLRLLADKNRAGTADPRTLAHTFSGIEIVDVQSVLSDPNHRYADRVKPLAGMLFRAAMDSMNHAKEGE